MDRWKGRNMQDDEAIKELDVFSAKDLVSDVFFRVLKSVERFGTIGSSADEKDDSDHMRYWFYLPDPVSEETHVVIMDVDMEMQGVSYTVVSPRGIGLSEDLPPVDGVYNREWVDDVVSSIMSILDGNIESERDSVLPDKGPNPVWLFSELLSLRLNRHFSRASGFRVYMERPGRLDSYASVGVVHHDGTSTGKATAYLNKRGNAVDVFIAPDAGHAGETHVVDFDGIPVDKLGNVAHAMANLLEVRAMNHSCDDVWSAFERSLGDYGVYTKNGCGYGQ